MSYETALHAPACEGMAVPARDRVLHGLHRIVEPDAVGAASTALEWNVRLSQVTSPDILDKFQATFDSYWEEPDFESYDPAADAQRFDLACRPTSTIDSLQLSAIDVIPFPHQREILERLAVERESHHRFRTLVVAATGTGKTIVAAFDYRRLRDELGDRRCSSWRTGRNCWARASAHSVRCSATARSASCTSTDIGQSEWRHVFASVQSLAQLDLADLETGGVRRRDRRRVPPRRSAHLQAAPRSPASEGTSRPDRHARTCGRRERPRLVRRAHRDRAAPLGGAGAGPAVSVPLLRSARQHRPLVASRGRGVATTCGSSRTSTPRNHARVGLVRQQRRGQGAPTRAACGRSGSA